jgi:hypothetical protein
MHSALPHSFFDLILVAAIFGLLISVLISNLKLIGWVL